MKKIAILLSVVVLAILSFSMLLTAANPQNAFKAPLGWNPALTKWYGEYKNDKAEGLGALIEEKNGKMLRFFFGRLVKGEMELGVIDDEGYMAGWFKNGDLIPSDNRQTFTDGFDEGAKAALEVAKIFRKAGNSAMAKFFEDKAKKLTEALD